jgi:hypothetical protein
MHKGEMTTDHELCHIMSFLDAKTLAKMNTVIRHEPERVAKELVRELCKKQNKDPERFKLSWTERLHIEQSYVSVDMTKHDAIAVENRTVPNTMLQRSHFVKQDNKVILIGLGPKLLVSDKSTKDQPVLCWRVRISGNSSIEFGAVFDGCEAMDDTLHRGFPEEAIGICSHYTVDSLQPISLAIGNGSIVEIVIQKGRMDVIVEPVSDVQEIPIKRDWSNEKDLAIPPPNKINVTMKLPTDKHMRLATTMWASGSFEFLL